jgi:programmed cell death protein 5|uniref:Programmed cell death protein 5 n=1 Tax=Prasinoderma singulare TaxID=676789 RepID=A0A7S3BF14_9VIRI|mmetsp:Transcript_1613/g.4711  ORF Transcript_1613/g.4711 Transcript_1613/m.4711 type:complete len:118 (+) Transcript_1613:48-401(+)
MEGIDPSQLQQMGGGDPNAAAKAAEQKAAQEEQRAALLAGVLKPEARERLARIALVKPDKARGVEEFIMQQAARGQITEKISEDRLISMVENFGGAAAKPKATTTFRRRNIMDDDEW